jgi:hypothetical protein
MVTESVDLAFYLLLQFFRKKVLGAVPFAAVDSSQ